MLTGFVVRTGWGRRIAMITKETKEKVITDYALHPGDSGSPEVQVALLTSRISYLSDHLKTHKKDHASRRGLLKMVGQRASLLKYLQRNDRDRYSKLISRLGLRK